MVDKTVPAFGIVHLENKSLLEIFEIFEIVLLVVIELVVGKKDLIHLNCIEKADKVPLVSAAVVGFEADFVIIVSYEADFVFVLTQILVGFVGAPETQFDFVNVSKPIQAVVAYFG